MPLRELEPLWPELRGKVGSPLLSSLVTSRKGGPVPAIGAKLIIPDDVKRPIQRCVYHNTTLDDAVLTALSTSTHLFARTGFTKEGTENFSKYFFKDGPVVDYSFSDSRWVRLEDVASSQSPEGMSAAFDKLCREHPSREVHWVERAAGGALLWRATRGDGRAVAAFARPLAEGVRCRPRAPQCVHAAAEASAWEARALLLLGEPGAGKSSFVARAAAEARSRQPARWHVVVPLLAHRHLLDAMPPTEELEQSDLLALVAAAGVQPGDQASRRCLEAALFRSGAVTVYVDGVDEVVPKHKDKAMRLLQLFLQQTHPGARLWVASRPEVQAALCGVLSCTPVSLMPLSRSQQLRFLSEQWASRLHVPLASVEPLAREMVNAVAHIHNKRGIWSMNTFIPTHSIPKVITDVLTDTFRRHCVVRDQQTSDELMCIEKIAQTASKKVLGSFSMFVSPSVVLNNVQRILEELKNSLNIRIFDLVKEKKEDLMQDIVDSLNDFNSTLLQDPLHLTLVADCFLEEIDQAVKSQRKLLKGRLNLLAIFRRFIEIKRKHFQIKHERGNVNSSTWSPDMESKIFKEMHQIYALKIFSEYIDENYNNFLEENIRRFSEYLPKEKTGILWELEDKRPEFAHFSYVEYFVALWVFENLTTKHSDLAKRIMKDVYGKRFNSLVVVFLDLMFCEGHRLHQAVLNGDLRGVKEALAQGEPADAVDGGGRSALHLAAACGMSDAVEALVGAGTSVKAQDGDGNQAIHNAAFMGHADFVNILLNNEADIEAMGARNYTALLFAVKGGREKVTSFLLSKGANVNAQDSDGNQAIHIAACEGHTKIIKMLLKKGADIEALGKGNNTALLFAAKAGHQKVTSCLLSNGANIKAKNSNRNQAIHVAALNGHKEIVKMLLNEGANIEALGDGNNTALIVAATAGHKEVTSFLLSRGANVKAQDSYGNMAIHEAACNGYPEIVKLLLSNGADIEDLGNRNFTALMVAAHRGHVEMTSFLLSRHANVKAQSTRGNQAIHLAAFRGWTEIIKMLLTNGAHIDDLGAGNRTALLCAAQTGSQDVTAFLLSIGANVKTHDCVGNQAIHVAAFNGHTDIIKLLLNNGADIEAVGNNNSTALHFAAQEGHEEMALFLLEKGANVKAENGDGNQAIHIAALNGHTEIIKMLLKEGADMEAVGKGKYTPLLFAAKAGRHEVISFLLFKNANVKAEDSDGKRAIDVAISNGHIGIAKILAENGADTENLKK